MIRDQWYVVLESKDVQSGKITRVTRMGEKMIFWRDPGGKVVCMVDLCPHLGARLSQGKINGASLACPFHGFEFNHSGTCTYIPALGQKGTIPKAMRAGVYPTYEAHDLIWIYWGQNTQVSAPPNFFESIDGSFSYMTFTQLWGVHYSRMIENQLDVMHLPFVHHNTIGRGGRTVVDGPLVRLQDDLLQIWVYNRLDDGSPTRRADDLPAPERHPFLEFRFPNIWNNWISDRLHIFIAFVPIDEENGILLGRYYQNMVQFPVAREFINFLGVWGSIAIANQDKKIVERIWPKKSEFRKMQNKPIQGDAAIITYRRRRQELKDAAGQED